MKTTTRFSPTVIVTSAGDYVSKFGGTAEAWSDIVQAGIKTDFVVTSASEMKTVMRRLRVDGFTNLNQTEVPAN